MGLFATDDVCGRDYVACGASWRGLFAALVVEIVIFVSMFGVYLVGEVRIDGDIYGVGYGD